MKPPVQRGIVVISQKGRDKGRLFVVLCEMDADFVLICDGETRPIARLKKKRRKHLMPTCRFLNELLPKYDENRLLDSDVRKALDAVRGSLSDGAK